MGSPHFICLQIVSAEKNTTFLLVSLQYVIISLCCRFMPFQRSNFRLFYIVSVQFHIRVKMTKKSSYRHMFPCTTFFTKFTSMTPIHFIQYTVQCTCPVRMCTFSALLDSYRCQFVYFTVYIFQKGFHNFFFNKSIAKS